MSQWDSLPQTSTLHSPDRAWDVVVIGAGPAGALAAYLLAKRSLRTLLVERAEFPRDKVCGGCVNRRGLSLLAGVGLGAICDSLGAPIIRRMQLCCGGITADLTLPPSRAVSRRTFDAALVAQARDAGAEFWPSTKASVLPCGQPADDAPVRTVAIERAGRPVLHISAKLVLAADGLGHPSLSQLGNFNTVVAERALVGIGSQLTRSAWSVPVGTICMSVGRHGYVGAVQVEGNDINVAAAIDVQTLRSLGATRAVESVLREAGGFASELGDVTWRGTRPLTCHANQVAETRLFLLGDAAGYVEPFTGEGIAWALTSAMAVAPLAAQACDTWSRELPTAWEKFHAEQKWHEQRICRTVAGLLRRPLIARSTVGLLRWWPELAAPLVRRINRRDRKRGVDHWIPC